MKHLFILGLIFIAFNTYAQRNVILIIADDLGTDYCGFYEDYADTANLPNIRRLLNKGVRFTNVMSNPVCSPTRAGILTGRYSFRTGVGEAVGAAASHTLDTSEITIPRILKKYNASIATANIGKWHLHLQTPSTNLQIPNLMGYDHYAGNFLGALTNYYNWTKITNAVSAPCTNYATTETANDAIKWVKNQGASPFFLWLAFNAPHTPLHLPPAGLHSYTTLSGTTTDINANPKLYFKASLEALDHEIGRLFDSLIVYNKMDSTDFIFIGDNGNGIRSSQIADSSRAKGSIYQYGVQVPYIISGPSIVNPNRVSKALVNTHDLFATIIELFGATNWQSKIPVGTTIDSKSILPVLKDQSDSIRPWIFTEIFKVISDSADGKTMRNLDYKLLNFDYNHQEFYHLSIDPTESNDLLLGNLSATELGNYNYLCNEMTTLVGSGSFCKSLDVTQLQEDQIKTLAYPNPFVSQIHISENSSPESFELSNFVGQIIYQGSQIESQDFSILAKGVYFLRKSQGGSEIVKLIKE